MIIARLTITGLFFLFWKRSRSTHRSSSLSGLALKSRLLLFDSLLLLSLSSSRSSSLGTPLPSFDRDPLRSLSLSFILRSPSISRSLSLSRSRSRSRSRPPRLRGGECERLRERREGRRGVGERAGEMELERLRDGLRERRRRSRSCY